MKKTFLFIGIFLLILNAYGQNSQIEFGVKGGINYSSFADNNDDDIPVDYKAKIGYHLGGFVEFMFSEKLSIRPEFIYSKQGSNFTINGENLNIVTPIGSNFFITSIDGEINESLLLLPIIIEYNFNKKINLELGPQLGYSLNRDVEFDDNPLGGGFIKNSDDEKFELGLALGVGYHVSNDAIISLRYNYGVIERHNLNTSVIQLGMNYKI